MACRMEALKGHAVLLNALGQLMDLPGWECWVAGGAQRLEEEHYVEGLRARAVRLGIAGRVRFLGQRSDVPRLLVAADVYCQPNTRPESFGISFVEALYAGLPVVTTALGGALEIVDDGCGALVPPGDAAALAATLHRLLERPEERWRLGQAGPLRAADLCDPERSLQRLVEVLRSAQGANNHAVAV
jgi:glycosyltransferase involved in cell wall biosynthesis